jgi:hypothetical protein
MLNNSVVIGLAIISVVCVYLIWENFKMSSKLKHIESAVNESIQIVQGLVNNPICMPPQPNNLSHPLHQHIEQQSHNNSQKIQQQTPQQPAQQPQAQEIQQSGKKETNPLNQMMGGSGGLFQNIFSNIIKAVEQNGGAFEEFDENMEMEMETDESSTEEDGKIQEIEEIEPLEMTDELKEQINNLTFNEPKSDDFSDIDNLDLEEVTEDTPAAEPVVEVEEVKAAEPVVEAEEVKAVEPVVEVEEVKAAEPVVETQEVKAAEPVVEAQEVKAVEPVVEAQEVKAKEDDLTSMIDDIDEIGDIDMGSSEAGSHDIDAYLTNPDLLAYLPLKQLQEIAEKNKLGKRGSKEQLITRIKRNMKLKA